MSKLFTILFLFICNQFVYGQTIDIPDDKLKQILIGCTCADLNGDGNFDGIVDTNDDNEISVVEAEAVIGLRILKFDIVNPEGLQFFKNLTYLKLGNNDIAAFDPSPFTELEIFDCSGNELSELDLSKNPNLLELDCGSNNLQDIDLSNQPELKVLDIGGNMFSSINLDANRAIEKLVLGSNLFTELVFNDHPQLNDLSILPNDLSRLEIKNNPSLENLKLRGRAFQNDGIPNIKITDNENLTSVILELLILERLDLSNNNITVLEHYSESSLKYFDISDNINFSTPFLYLYMLEHIDIENTALTSIQIFGDIDYYNFNTNVPISVNFVNLLDDVIIKDQTSIQSLNISFDDRNTIHNATFVNIPNLEKLKIAGKVNALELVDFPKLHDLEVDVLTLDLTRVGLRNIGNSNFITKNIQVSEYLKVEQCDLLRSIYYRGQTKKVIFTQLDELDALFVEDAEIEDLVINFCTTPQLELRSSILNAAEVTQNELGRMRIAAGTIDYLNIEGNLGLAQLDTRSTALGTLNIINNPDLILFEMYQHAVKELNLRSLDKLKEMWTKNIDLDSMYIQNLPSLELFDDALHTTTRSLFLENLPRLKKLTLLSRNVNPDSIHGINLTDFPSLDSLHAIGRNEIKLCNLNALSYLVLTPYDEQVIDLSSCPNLKEVSIGGIGNNKRLNLANGTNLIEALEIRNDIDTICVDDVTEQMHLESLISQDVVFSLTCASDEINCGSTLATTNVVSGNLLLDSGAGCMDMDQEINYTVPIKVESLSFEGTIYSSRLNDFIYSTTAADENVTLRPVINLPYYTIEPAELNISFTGIGDNLEQSFCLSPLGQISDLEVLMFPLGQARPGLEASYSLTVKNIGNQTFSGPISLSFDGSVLTFVSTSVIPDSEAVSNLSWNISDLPPLTNQDIEVTFLLNKPSDTPPLVGDEDLKFEAQVTNSDDEDPVNNIFVLNQSVVNSLDPNDKICLIGKELAYDKRENYLYYQIRFENVGTADAINIEIIDELDASHYDLNTFLPIRESHLAKISLVNNIIKYQFNNINLSFEAGENQGYILFKIKALKDITYGDRLENDADIFFDFNDPIKTNNYSTLVIDVSSSIDENPILNELRLTPNPVFKGDEISIELITDDDYILSVFSSDGRLMDRLSARSNSKYSTSELNKGLYILELKSKTKRYVEKLIII